MSDTVLLIEAEWQLRELVSGQEIRFGDPAKVGYASELGDKNVLKLKPGVERTCEARLTAAEALKMVDVLDAERSGTSIVVRGGDVQITGQFQVEQDGVGYLLKGRVKALQLPATYEDDLIGMATWLDAACGDYPNDIPEIE